MRPFHFCRRGPGGQSLRQRRIDYLKIVFHTVFLFVLGIAVCFLITEVGKRKKRIDHIELKLYILFRRNNWSIKTVLFNCL